MNYTELRTAVAENITDQKALVALMTSSNIDEVSRCAPGLAVVNEPYQPADAQGTYLGGQAVAQRMYDDKSTPSTVDEVLAEFTSSNAYAAQQYINIKNQIKMSGVDPSEYFEALEDELNQTDTLLC